MLALLTFLHTSFAKTKDGDKINSSIIRMKLFILMPFVEITYYLIKKGLLNLFFLFKSLIFNFFHKFKKLGHILFNFIHYPPIKIFIFILVLVSTLKRTV